MHSVPLTAIDAMHFVILYATETGGKNSEEEDVQNKLQKVFLGSRCCLPIPGHTCRRCFSYGIALCLADRLASLSRWRRVRRESHRDEDHLSSPALNNTSVHADRGIRGSTRMELGYARAVV